MAALSPISYSSSSYKVSISSLLSSLMFCVLFFRLSVSFLGQINKLSKWREDVMNACSRNSIHVCLFLHFTHSLSLSDSLSSYWTLSSLLWNLSMWFVVLSTYAEEMRWSHGERISLIRDLGFVYHSRVPHSVQPTLYLCLTVSRHTPPLHSGPGTGEILSPCHHAFHRRTLRKRDDNMEGGNQ